MDIKPNWLEMVGMAIRCWWSYVHYIRVFIKFNRINNDTMVEVKVLMIFAFLIGAIAVLRDDDGEV